MVTFCLYAQIRWRTRMSTNKFLMWLKFGSRLRISGQIVLRQICKIIIIVKLIFMILKIRTKMSSKKKFRKKL